MRDTTTITMEDLSRPANGIKEILLGARLALDLVELSWKRKMQSFKALIHEIAKANQIFLTVRYG